MRARIERGYNAYHRPALYEGVLTIRLDSKFSEQTNTCEFRKAVKLAYGQGGLNRDKYTSAAYFSKSKGGLIIEEGVILSEYGISAMHKYLSYTH